MTRRIVLAAAFALALAPTTARAAKISASFYPGVTIPMGDFADDSLGNAQTGFQLGVALDALLTERISAGIEASWMVNNTGLEGETIDQGGGFYTRADQDQFETKQFGARARYFLKTGNFRPFTLAGMGLYDLSHHYEYVLGGPVPTQEVKQSGSNGFGSNFGWKAGLGFEGAVSPSVLLGLTGEYNSVSVDENDLGTSTFSFWAIRASIGHEFGGH